MRRRSGDFTLRQLDIFVCAARSGSFALAASELGISQPAVSDHIATLEHHLGHRLFDRRRGTTPTLTREGIDMLHRAETLLSTSRTMRGDDAARRADETRVRVRLSIGSRTRDLYLKPLLTRIYMEMPNVELEILPALPAAQIATALDSGDIDLVFCTLGQPPPQLSNIHVVGDVPIQMVAAPQVATRLAAGALRIEELQFILPFAVIAEQWLERQLTLNGIRPTRPVRYLEFPDVIQSIVEDGLAVSILMKEQVAPAIAAGRLVRFGPQLEPMRRIIARSSRAPRAAEALERLLIMEVAHRIHQG